MSDIKAVLKEMIARIARHEIKIKVTPLNRNIKELKLAGRQMQKIIARQQKELSALSKNILPEDTITTLSPESLEGKRLSPKLISALRRKLKLSRKDFAQLIGTTSNTVFLWENGKAKPRSAAKARIISIRGLGKRQVKEILKTASKQ